MRYLIEIRYMVKCTGVLFFLILVTSKTDNTKILNYSINFYYFHFYSRKELFTTLLSWIGCKNVMFV